MKPKHYNPVPKEDKAEKWIITWKINSEYLAQETLGQKLPAGHTQTDIIKNSPEYWVQNNPQKSLLFCYRVQ